MSTSWHLLHNHGSWERDNGMGRMRERESGTDFSPIDMQVTSYDMSYPFNGPWTSNVSYKTITLPTIPDYSEVCLDELHPGPPWKSGGPLTLHRVETDQRSQCVAGPVLGGTPGQIQRIEILRVFPAAWPTSYLSYTNPQLAFNADWGDPSSWGATAWNRFQPTFSSGNGAVCRGNTRFASNPYGNGPHL